ncbi:MAG: aminotransferase class I/II-fold pyridoxal phosphate-dependent enzyme [Pseudomonadota bacterium]
MLTHKPQKSHHYDIYAEKLNEKKKQNLFRHLEQNIDVAHPGYLKQGERLYLNFSSNDYLGFAHHPDIITAGHEAALKYGAGSGSARPVSGNYSFYDEVEKKLAKYKKKDSAIIGASGFQVNSTVISALLQPFGQKLKVFFDKYNHASMYFGLQHAGHRPIRYRHNDMHHLEALIEKYAQKDDAIFIMSESVFSMDGDICPIKDLATIAKKYNAMTFIDDAHSIDNALSDYAEDIDIILGTCSKAFGAFGGYIACDHDIADYLRNFATGLIYSTALPPFIWGAIDKALDLLMQDTNIAKNILNRAAYLRTLLQHNGLDTGHSKSQIIPIILGSNERALHFESKLKEAGYFTKAIRSPTVPADTARLRLSLTPYISKEACEDLGSALIKFMNSAS